MAGRILVIEDNPANLELMSYLLRAFGYTVLTAGDGAEGIEMARRELLDLIVCDIHLPNVDGYQVAKYLKGHPVLRQLPLIAVTALAMVGDREKVIAAGFDGYIDKPIAPETFVTQIGSYLPADRRASVPAAQAAGTVTVTVTAVSQHASPNSLRILVLDDSPANRKLLRSILEHAGYEVADAENISQAMALIAEHAPDAIISDLHIGKERGWEFLDRVRARPELKGVPFVFLSASWPANELGKAKALGADAVLLRPMESQELLANIEAVIMNKQKES